MLSIGAMGSGQAGYYTGLAREDYYLAGGEPPGHYIGQGSRLLGLGGPEGTDFVQTRELYRLFNGFSPEGQRLVESAGRKTITYLAPDGTEKTRAGHRPGFDLTYSAPKSVSAAWAVADPEVRAAIQKAHFEAVKGSIGYLEEHAAWSRSGKGGAFPEKAQGLVVTSFEHGTARATPGRAPDPQLHTHTLVMNIAVGGNGENGNVPTKALDARPLFRHKMAAGAIYRAELSTELERLGFSIERTGSTFEIAGVPKAFCAELSTRREAILQAMREQGVQGPKAAAQVTLETRTSKASIPRAELFSQWQERGTAHEFDARAVQNLLSERPERNSQRNRAEESQAAIGRALQVLTQDKSHFSEAQFFRQVAEEAQGRGVGALHQEAKAYLKSAHLIELRSSPLAGHYTTRAMFELEKTMLADVQHLDQSDPCLVRETALRGAIRQIEVKESVSLSSEQREALRHITAESGGIKTVSGMAGTGKTTMLSAARTAWESEGWRVVGACLAAAAAERLESGAGIPSVTIHRLLGDFESKGSESKSDPRQPKKEFLRASSAPSEEIGIKGTGAEGHKIRPEPKLPPEKASAWEGALHKVCTEFRYATYQIDAFTRARRLGEEPGEQAKRVHALNETLRPVMAHLKHVTGQIDRDSRDKMLGIYHKPTSELAHALKHATGQISQAQRKYLDAALKSDAVMGSTLKQHEPTSQLGHAWKYATWQITRAQQRYLDAKLEAQHEAKHGVRDRTSYDARGDAQGGAGDKSRHALNGKTVLVIDEASMVGTRQMTRLIQEVKERGGKIVLIGDERQLQAIEAGGPFQGIQARLEGGATLKEIVRQRHEWQREAIHQFAEGKADIALGAYIERGCVKVEKNRLEAMKSLIADWKERGLSENKQALKETLILSGTREETRQLNRMAQRERYEAGKLGWRCAEIGGESGSGERIHERDRVLFTQNSARYGVRNGNQGTVTLVDEKKQTLHVQLDGGQKVEVPWKQYRNEAGQSALQLGYCLTVHKAQGATVEHAFILAGGYLQDRELTYVQMSRAREATRLYADQREVGKDFSVLLDAMKQSRQKDLAHDVKEGRDRAKSPLQTQDEAERRNERQQRHELQQELVQEHVR